jgi:membrane protein
MNLPTTFKATLKLTWQERITHLLAVLKTWPWLDTAITLRQRFREDRLGLTAGSLTFTTLISLVPLVTVMLALFSAFPMFASFQVALENYFLQSLVPDSIAKPVLAALTQFAGKANRLGTFGLVFLVVTALALMLTIDRSLNAIWRVRQPRPIAQRVLVYWAAVTLGPLLLGMSLSLTSYAISASRGVVSAMPGGVAMLLNALEFALLAAGLASLFHYVPNTHVRWRHALAGGVFSAVCFEVAKSVLGWYVRQVPTYAMVYGAFATVPIFLVWIYISWLLVLLGAVVAAYAPSLQMRSVRRASGPGHRFELALSLLRELAVVQRTAAHGLNLQELSMALRVDPLQIEPLLETLLNIDWVARLDEGDAPRYVLLCEPATTLAQPLLKATLLTETANVLGFWRSARLNDLTLQDLMSAPT